jgi:hypothetical protein
MVIKNIGTSADSRAFKKGNVAIGDKPYGYGPTTVTGYWNGIDPPSGGHTLYLMGNASTTVSPSIYTADSNSELINLVNLITGQNYTTIPQVLAYVNSDNNVYLDSDISQNAVMMVDSYDQQSYPGNGSIWYDISGNGNNITLYNSPSYTNNNIDFDGANDYGKIASTTYRSISLWGYQTNSGPSGWKYLFDARSGMGSGWFANNSQGSNWSSTMYINGVSVSRNWSNVPVNSWFHLYIQADNSYTGTINLMSRYSNNEQLGGYLNSIELYNTTKSDDDIALLFNSKRNRFGL